MLIYLLCIIFTGVYTTAMGSTATSSSQALKRNSDDMGWEFAQLCDPLDPQAVKCKLCGKEMHGGVNRMKQHIAGIKGQVSPCLVANDDEEEDNQQP